MSDDFKDLESFLNDDAITTPPIKSKKHPEGKPYKIQSPDAETGLRLNGLATIAAKAAAGQEVSPDDVKSLVMDDAEERVFLEQVLGDAYHEMLADGVSWTSLQRLGQYAFSYFAVSPAAANKGVREGIFAGKVQTPTNREARRKKPSGAKSGRPASAGSSRPTKKAG